jgi:hypothetical protein
VVAGYPRPLAASPFRVALVVAYEECTSPNRTHGPPLDHPSCSISEQTSRDVPPHVTVGTSDANGPIAQSTGFVRMGVAPGDPSTPADEADVKLHASITDVRCRPQAVAVCGQPQPNMFGPPDYAGELQGRVRLRITDRDNTPNPGGPGPGTTTDYTFTFTIACTGTAENIGSSCDTDTTMDALIPGIVKERRRTIGELGQVDVLDGGPDGDVDTPADAYVFLRQGVFIR